MLQTLYFRCSEWGVLMLPFGCLLRNCEKHWPLQSICTSLVLLFFKLHIWWYSIWTQCVRFAWFRNKKDLGEKITNGCFRDWHKKAFLYLVFKKWSTRKVWPKGTDLLEARTHNQKSAIWVLLSAQIRSYKISFLSISWSFCEQWYLWEEGFTGKEHKGALRGVGNVLSST